MCLNNFLGIAKFSIRKLKKSLRKFFDQINFWNSDKKQFERMSEVNPFDFKNVSSFQNQSDTLDNSQFLDIKRKISNSSEFFEDNQHEQYYIEQCQDNLNFSQIIISSEFEKFDSFDNDFNNDFNENIDKKFEQDIQSISQFSDDDLLSFGKLNIVTFLKNEHKINDEKNLIFSDDNLKIYLEQTNSIYQIKTEWSINCDLQTFKNILIHLTQLQYKVEKQIDSSNQILRNQNNFLLLRSSQGETQNKFCFVDCEFVDHDNRLLKGLLVKQIQNQCYIIQNHEIQDTTPLIILKPLTIKNIKDYVKSFLENVQKF